MNKIERNIPMEATNCFSKAGNFLLIKICESVEAKILVSL